jgi:hypothetical protein
MVPYNPSAAGRTQGDHCHGTWNTGQNPPNAYYMQNGKADRMSCGASMLIEAPVQAVVTEAHRALATKLAVDSCLQIGIGPPNNCSDTQINCFLCNFEPLLTSIHSQLLQQDVITDNSSTPTNELGKDLNLLPCSIAIINLIQQIQLPIQALFDGGSDTTFIHERSLPLGATPQD